MAVVDLEPVLLHLVPMVAWLWYLLMGILPRLREMMADKDIYQLAARIHIEQVVAAVDREVQHLVLMRIPVTVVMEL